MPLPKTPQEYNNAVENLDADVELFGNGLKKQLTFIPTDGISTSATDGQDIYENIKSNSVARNEDDLHKLLKHEYSHILFQSNQATVDLVSQKYPKVARDLIADIYNIIEDYRIEENWSKAFPADRSDFEDLKKNLKENAIQRLKKDNKVSDTPIDALFAARIGNNEILKGAPKEIETLYPEYKKQLQSLNGKSYLASYPVLRDVVAGMEKWLEEKSKDYFKRKQQEEQLAKQLGKIASVIPIIQIGIGIPMPGAGNQQGQQQGGQGQQGGAGNQQSQQQGQSAGSQPQGVSGGTSTQTVNPTPQGGGGAGELNNNPTQQPQQPVSWDNLPADQKKQIIDAVTTYVRQEIQRIDTKGESEKSTRPSGSSVEEQKKLEKEVKDKTDQQIGKEATKQGAKEEAKAIEIMIVIPPMHSPAASKILQASQENKVVQQSKLLQERKIREISGRTQSTTPNQRRSYVITRHIQEILHRSQKTNVRRGMTLNYPNLIRKTVTPEKKIDVFNKKQMQQGGEYWFLLDISSSMTGGRLKALKEVILTLYDSIAHIDKNIKFRIFAFNSEGIAELNRQEIVEMGASGGTPTPYALAKIYDKMRTKPARNTERTLFVISDGQPGENRNFTTNHVLNFFKRKGISVFSILVGDDITRDTEAKFSGSKAVYTVQNTAAARPLLERIIIRDIAKRLRV